jgi:thioester reductase-like protein/amino acid adenylation domain-containing protein
MEGVVRELREQSGKVHVETSIFGRPVPVEVESNQVVRMAPRIRVALEGSNLLAYVIYTSGSTGQPKGVEVTHANLMPMLAAQVTAFALVDRSRCLWMLNPAFDASISDFGTCLLSGGTLFIEHDEQLRDPASLVRLMHDRQITHVDVPPSLLPLLSPAQMPASLKTIIIGGEVCPPAVVRHWARPFRLVNVYGPTEATVCTSLCVCDPDTWTEPLVGNPLPGVIYVVMDEQMRPVGNADSGELWISGPCLARGYRNNPTLTSQKFGNNPWNRYYRTGDRVRRREDGALVFLGRVDRMLKLRGILIEPEEIEVRLRDVPGITEAAVVLRDDALVAFVSGDAIPSDADVRARLSRTLPASMQPRRIARLASLPRSSSGKIDFPALAATTLPPDDVPEADGTLGVLLTLTGELLGGRPDPDAGFLDQGGDSLSLLRLVAAATSKGLAVPPALLASRPLSDVAAFLDGRSNGAPLGAVSAAVLRQDVERLAEQVRNGRSCPPPGAPQQAGTILLTGATGFFGSHLLLELLRQTEAEVVCLVRATGSRCGKERLWQSLTARGLSLRTEERRRVGVIAGDLGSPRLGLAKQAWEQQARRIDSVYHAAANVNLVHPYLSLCRDNVAGTAEVLRLCGESRPKRLHYVSTLSVFVATDRDRGVAFEADDLTQTRWVHGGYAQSKYASEWLVRRASTGGVTYYRPGLITPDSRGGPLPPRDLLGLFLRGVAKLGCLPRCDRTALRLDVTPVDFAARALVYLSLHAADSPPHTFHLSGGQPVTLADLAAALERAGVTLEEVDARAWQERLTALQGEDAAAWLALCRALPAGHDRFRTLDLFQAGGVTFDATHAQAALRAAKIACPPIDAALLGRYVRTVLS